MSRTWYSSRDFASLKGNCSNCSFNETMTLDFTVGSSFPPNKQRKKRNITFKNIIISVGSIPWNSMPRNAMGDVTLSSPNNKRLEWNTAVSWRTGRVFVLVVTVTFRHLFLAHITLRTFGVVLAAESEVHWSAAAGDKVPWELTGNKCFDSK